MNKFKENEANNNSINIKVNSNNINNNNNNDLFTQHKVLRKNSLLLPLLNKKTQNSNFTINNEINCFRKQKHRKSVEPKTSNISINQINKNNINNENHNILSEQKEKNNEDNLEYINDLKSLYKTKVNSCKQVRVKKNFKED